MSNNNVHMSYSRVKNHIGFCAYSNYLKYVKEVQPLQWQATLFGKEVHQYIANLYRGITVDLPAGDRYDSFKEIPKSEYLLTNPTLVEGQSLSLYSNEPYAGLLRGWHNNIEIVGVPDIVQYDAGNSTIHLVDYKTGKIRLSPDEIDKDGQLNLYRWLLEKNNWTAANWIYSHCYITKSGKNVKWVTTKSRSHIKSVKLILQQVSYVYQSEIVRKSFPAVAGVDQQTCRMCGYRDRCPINL